MNEQQTESTITAEQLLANGWIKTGDPSFPYKKVLTDTESEDYEEEDGVLELVMHGMYNTWVFALSLPDGGLLNINPVSIEDLNAFETLIYSYDPPF